MIYRKSGVASRLIAAAFSPFRVQNSSRRFTRAFIRIFNRQRSLWRSRALKTSGLGTALSAAWFTSGAVPNSKMPDENSAEAAIQKAAEFYAKSEFQSVYDTLVKHKSDTSSCELQWQLARACRDLATLTSTSPQMKKDLTYEGLECAENAVKADDNNFAGHKWKGILLSDVGDYEGSKKKIQNAYIIRDEFEKASKLNPNDALCYFLLGEWCYTVSDMSWMLRQAAKAIFGTPPSSTFEEALKNFLKAEEVNSGFYVGNYVSIGKTYQKLRKPEEAKKWFQKALDYDAENEKDTILIQEAKEHLKGL